MAEIAAQGLCMPMPPVSVDHKLEDGDLIQLMI